jgi:hypothetical protein
MSILPPYDLSRDEIVYLIEQFIFSRRDRSLSYDRLIEGMTYEELAEKYYMSVRHIKNLIHKNKDIIFSHVDRLP